MGSALFLAAMFLFKLAMFDVTDLFTRDWELEMQCCIAVG